MRLQPQASMFEGWKAKKLVAGLGGNVPAAVVDQFRALGEAGIDALMAGLRDPSPPVRAGAARVLGELGPPRVIGQLAECAAELPEAASALAAILSRSVRPRVFHAVKGAGSAMFALAGLLTASEQAMRAAAEQALLRTGPHAAGVLATVLETEELRAPALRLLGQMGPEGIAAVVPLLEHPRREVREQATAALRSFGWRPAGQGEEVALAAALQDWQRCRELGEAATGRLVALLGDADSTVRQAAARALGSLKDPRAVMPLTAALDDRKEPVRLAAVEALGEIGDARAAQPLLARLRSSYDLRAPVLEALRRIGWTPGNPADAVLLAVLTQRKEALADAAARRFLIDAACEQDYSQLPEDVVLRGLGMLENADADLLRVLRRGGRTATTVREALNARRPAEDQYVLCAGCLAYLGIRKQLRAAGHLHCGDCGAPVVV